MPTDIKQSQTPVTVGIRHVVVHNAGVVTTDFVKRHPSAAGVVGERLKGTLSQLNGFVQAMKEFIEPTDRYFLARHPSLIAPTSSEPVARAKRR